jgi:hypothetical protein
MDSAADTHCWVGCPIRRFRDQRVLAPPPDFSQRATSFIASQRQGIHQMPFIHSPRSSSEPPLAQKAHFLSKPTAEPPTLHCRETSVPAAKPERPKTSIPCLEIAQPRTRTAMANQPCSNPVRTNSCEQHLRTPLRYRSEPQTFPTIDRVARARPDLPLHDVQRTITHPSFGLHQAARTRTSNGGITSRACHTQPLHHGKAAMTGAQSGYRHARCWWAWADLNSRPHAYQACALTN